MKIFGDGNQPGLELVGVIVGVYFVESAGKGADGDVFRIVFIFGAEQLKSVHIVPKGVQECAEGNLVSFLCLLDDVFDGIVGFFQKCGFCLKYDIDGIIAIQVRSLFYIPVRRAFFRKIHMPRHLCSERDFGWRMCQRTFRPFCPKS